MIAAYRVLVEGMSIETAVAEMQQYQGAWFKYDAEYIRSLTGDHRMRIQKIAEARIGQIRPEAHLECSSSGCSDVN